MFTFFNSVNYNLNPKNYFFSENKSGNIESRLSKELREEKKPERRDIINFKKRNLIV